MKKKIKVDDVEHISALCGTLNRNIQDLEKELHVTISLHEDGLLIEGAKEPLVKAETVILKLLDLQEKGNSVTSQLVNYLTQTMESDTGAEVENFSQDFVCFNARRMAIKSKTLGQKAYVEAIKANELVFSIGPAGTGKTYLAVAMAVKAFKKEKVSRIILTRPAVEAGENLGFLPGDLQMKVDPYMRPLYDALHDLMGADKYQKNIEKGKIEISPLAYMRGRTLDDAFIILDEAQNTTPAQMKMFLTRLGNNSKAVVTGDITQIDLPGHQKSGLKMIKPILEGLEGVAFITLEQRDVVRNPLVQRIIQAFDNAEAIKNKCED